ncbi:hypothetical protein GOP47_0030547 [Adiantum capillus-veneris]|nr:hypothetical protein GOP47_0030547 [Adiantum capillus-veneris]
MLTTGNSAFKIRLLLLLMGWNNKEQRRILGPGFTFDMGWRGVGIESQGEASPPSFTESSFTPPLGSELHGSTCFLVS